MGHDVATSGSEQLTTKTYKETPYEDEIYPVVGEPPGEERFVPMAVGVVGSTAAITDSMFDDFGGRVTGQSPELWHLPVGVRYVSEDSKRQEAEREASIQAEHERHLEQARAEGFEAGRQQAVEESQQHLQQQLAQINQKFGNIVQDIIKQLQERLADTERQAVKLAVDMVEKIIPHAVEINPEYIVAVLREALNLASTSIIKKVRVSPEDLEFINVVGVPKTLEQFDGSWEFIADDTIRAGCVVETSAGEVEYDLERAWARTKDKILKVMR